MDLTYINNACHVGNKVVIMSLYVLLFVIATSLASVHARPLSEQEVSNFRCPPINVALIIENRMENHGVLKVHCRSKLDAMANILDFCSFLTFMVVLFSHEQQMGNM